MDHTLWDYEKNSVETLHELYVGYDLSTEGIPTVDDFANQFKLVNEELWYQYDRGLIDSEVIRRERFKKILEPFNASNGSLSERISKDYLELCPKKANLMPYATEVLDYLKQRYKLAVITNGFEEIQHQKLSAGNLHGYFEHIITSQKAGHRKPSVEIFHYALKSNAVGCHEAIMIGDNLVTDVGGARNASIDPIFFNSEKIKHNEALDFEIHSLNELYAIL